MQLLLQIAQDSVIIAKLDQLSHAVDKLKTNNVLLPIGVAFLTGILVWIGQHFERKSKRKAEWRSQLLEAYYQCEHVLYQLKNLFQKLATDRSLVEFWWNYHVIAVTLEEEELIKKYEDRSTTCSNDGFDCLQQIGEKFSEYYATVMKFNVLANMDIDIKEIEKSIDNIVFETADGIEEKTYNDCGKKYEANKDKLKQAYLNKLAYFKDLNRSLHDYTYSQLKAPVPRGGHPPRKSRS